MFDIILLLAIIILVTCVLMGKPININITHVHKVEQAPEPDLVQLTDDELKGSALQDLAAAVQNALYDLDNIDIGGSKHVE